MAAGNDIEEMVQMHGLKRRLVVGLTLIAAFAFSGMALAASNGDDDTVLNYGYDKDNHFFIWNVTSLEYEPDEEALEETLEGYESEQLEALLEACGLEGDDPEDPVEYSYTYDPESGEITLGDGEGDTTDRPDRSTTGCSSSSSTRTTRVRTVAASSARLPARGSVKETRR